MYFVFLYNAFWSCETWIIFTFLRSTNLWYSVSNPSCFSQSLLDSSATHHPGVVVLYSLRDFRCNFHIFYFDIKFFHFNNSCLPSSIYTLSSTRTFYSPVRPSLGQGHILTRCPSQLGPLNVEEQQLYSKPLPDDPVLTLPVTDSLNTLREKLISATSDLEVVHSVFV